MSLSYDTLAKKGFQATPLFPLSFQKDFFVYLKTVMFPYTLTGEYVRNV